MWHKKVDYVRLKVNFRLKGVNQTKNLEFISFSVFYSVTVAHNH